MQSPCGKSIATSASTGICRLLKPRTVEQTSICVCFLPVRLTISSFPLPHLYGTSNLYTMALQQWLDRELGVKCLSPQAPATLHTLADYLEGKTQQADAVSSILKINHDTIYWKGTNEPLVFLWCHVSSASRFVGLDPSMGEKLVDLVIAFSRLPAPLNPRIINECQWSDAKRVWLGGFGWTFREYGMGE